MGLPFSSETVGKIGKMPKIEIIPSVKIEASIQPSIKQPSVTTIKEFPLQNNLFKSFKYSRYATEYSPQI